MGAGSFVAPAFRGLYLFSMASERKNKLREEDSTEDAPVAKERKPRKKKD